MRYAEAQRQYQVTLEAARAAMPHAPVFSTDPFEATEDTILADLEEARRERDLAWFEECYG
jgi:hypothetical protein